MSYYDFDEDLFRDRVGKALEHVNRILQVHRNPRTPDTVDHEYSDKYHLANLMTNINIIAHVNCLQKMGLTADILKNLDKTKTTTLRFQAFETCEFLKQVDVEIPMERTVETVEDTQTTSSSFFGSTTKATITRVVNRIKEYHWKVGIEWEISVYSGTNIHEKIVLQSKKSSTIVIIQSTKEAPIPKSREHPPMEASLTWLLEQIDVNSMVAKFKIDTTNPNTKTPSRNKQVENAMEFVNNMGIWANRVWSYFSITLQQYILERHNPAKGPPTGRLAKLDSDLWHNIFNPVVPLMEENQTADKINGEDGTPTTTDTANQQSILALGNDSENDSNKFSPVLSRTDITKIINEHLWSLEEKIHSLKKIFPHKHLSMKPLSVMEATIYLLCNHIGVIQKAYEDSVKYIEWMLEQQLIAAIGKRVNSTDMDKFVRFHNNKLLSVAPKPFCHSVRRPNHYPEGVLTIMAIDKDDSSSAKNEPIDTFVREVQMSSPLQVPLNAAATLELTGKTFLHGWLQHRFQDTSRSHKLIARARQFSSFMLVVGTMTGPNQLDPKDAIILQNKDEVIIPLLLEELPSAKEFKDAIQSLSPEQQRFAKSFRSMQLGSSVLGICIIQIKPQLEVLLNLPADSLTKEMKLTQDLMELFVEYQIPSDLLSYDGEGGETSVREKVEIVKSHVEAVMGVIGSAKKKQLEESTKKAKMAVSTGLSDAMFSAGPPLSISRSRIVPDGFHSSSSDRGLMAKYAPLAHRGGGIRRYSGLAGNPAPPRMSEQPNAKSIQTLQYTAERQQGLPQNIEDMEHEEARHDEIFASKPDGSNDQTNPGPAKNANNQGRENTDFVQAGKQNGDIDFTVVPKLLDALVETHDKDGSLRSTTIKTENSWGRKRQKDLLSKVADQKLEMDDIKSEKNKATDLLDALSRSGSLPIECSELHVMICLTHRFDKTVMQTVIQDNINPIEKLEMSTLLFASAIHGVPSKQLIREARDVSRLAASFPMLLE